MKNGNLIEVLIRAEMIHPYLFKQNHHPFSGPGVSSVSIFWFSLSLIVVNETSFVLWDRTRYLTLVLTGILHYFPVSLRNWLIMEINHRLTVSYSPDSCIRVDLNMWMWNSIRPPAAKHSWNASHFTLVSMLTPVWVRIQQVLFCEIRHVSGEVLGLEAVWCVCIGVGILLWRTLLCLLSGFFGPATVSLKIPPCLLSRSFIVYCQ